MNRQEILDEITKTEKHLAKMKEMLKAGEYGRWRPVKEERYFIVGARGVMDCVNIDEVLMGKHYAFYNCFQTKEQAETEAEKILIRRQLENIAKRLNGDKELSWQTTDNKYYLYYDHFHNETGIRIGRKCQCQGTIYCLNSKFLSTALKEIGEERLNNYLKGIT